jgi:N-acetyl-gamma-glutamyl-phosphate reductase
MVRVGIIGASGYSGAELLRLLIGRSDVSVNVLVANTSAGKNVEDLYPRFSGVSKLRFVRLEELDTHDLDLILLALPSGEAMNIVPTHISNGIRIIDLGGDFRLSDEKSYETYYGSPHAYPSLLGNVTYGLPELFHEDIRSSRFVSNPGCYPTSAILALHPVLKERIVEPDNIVITSLSGVSGAGRKASIDLSFTEINENVRAYKITGHQHVPEIKSVLQRSTGQMPLFSFVPHLIPVTRGIYTTIHCTLRGNHEVSEIHEVYNNYYGTAPFVRLTERIPQIQSVAHTNYCDIYSTITHETHQLIIISVIDNLVKGAAGQAIQNMNIMFGLKETTGLL